MYKLCFFVPDTHVEAVKQAVFASGAGRIGNYEACCWQVLGQGSFARCLAASRLLARRGWCSRWPSGRWKW